MICTNRLIHIYPLNHLPSKCLVLINNSFSYYLVQYNMLYTYTYTRFIMFVLESDLAQEIVNRTMAIIGNNINVMDTDGIIIGSGDLQRIGKMHEGALLALQQGDTVEIHPSEKQPVNGVLPGINLLLQVKEEVIGVVGITGSPADCRHYAKLVKMSAEMIVEQASLTEQLQWDRRHREEFINSWLENKHSRQELYDWAKRLDINMQSPRVAVLIRFREQDEAMSLEDIRKVVELLEYPKRDNLVAILSMSEIVVLKPATFNHGEWDSEDESNRIDLLLMRLELHGIKALDIALGNFFEGEKSISLSYLSARATLEVGVHQPGKQQKHLYEALRLPVLLSPLQQSWQGSELKRAYQRLAQADTNGQLTKTLIVLFENHLSLSECAKKLFIHRNTLRYRMKRIHQISKVDPEQLVGLMELYVGHKLQ